MAVTKVFIGGSRRIGRLGVEVRQRIDRMIERRLPVLIGDANGADKAVQWYLYGQRYDLVEVFCADSVPPNDVGGWPLRVICPARATRDFDYYATKDRAMATEATIGFMIWDGESRGTLLNILRLVTRHKPVVVCLDAERAFSNVRTDKTSTVCWLAWTAVMVVDSYEQAASEGASPSPRPSILSSTWRCADVIAEAAVPKSGMIVPEIGSKAPRPASGWLTLFSIRSSSECWACRPC